MAPHDLGCQGASYAAASPTPRPVQPSRHRLLSRSHQRYHMAMRAASAFRAVLSLTGTFVSGADRIRQTACAATPAMVVGRYCPNDARGSGPCWSAPNICDHLTPSRDASPSPRSSEYGSRLAFAAFQCLNRLGRYCGCRKSDGSLRSSNERLSWPSPRALRGSRRRVFGNICGGASSHCRLRCWPFGRSLCPTAPPRQTSQSPLPEEFSSVRIM